MGLSSIGAWVAFQIAMAEFIDASRMIDTACRRYGWQSITVGAVVAVADFVFVGLGLMFFAQRFLGPVSHLLSALLVTGAAIYLVRMSYLSFQMKKTSKASELYRPAIRSLPVNWSGTVEGFRVVVAPGFAILAVWLGVSLSLGCMTGSFGTLFGLCAMGLLATQVSGIDLSKQTDAPALYSLSAGVVGAFGCYLLQTSVHQYFIPK